MERLRSWAGAASRAASLALDLLLPVECLGCRRRGDILCGRCEGTLPTLATPYCPLCAEPGTPDLCRWCRQEPPPFRGLRAPYRFEGLVREAVHALKYDGVRVAAEDLGRLLAGFLERSPLPGEPVVVPVPLHPRRERERGYNQSLLLAREVARRRGLPLRADLLRRVRHTPPQVSLEGHEERRENLRGAFRCDVRVIGLRAVVVDDVATTGSTIRECAAALRRAGAEAVWGLAVARQGRPGSTQYTATAP